MSLSCLGGCEIGAKPPEQHTHTYEKTWSRDSVAHWHSANCGHDEIKDYAVHEYNGDDTCDVCNYVKPHTHTFESSWDGDASNHWKNATCGHDVKSLFGAHNFGADDVCDDCAYVRTHTHTYDSEWDKDGNYHWHNATCEHTTLKSDYEMHNYDGNYKCTDCGYQHTHTYATDWSNDGTNHWKVSTCGHDVKSLFGAHNFGNDDVCDDCGYTKEHTHTYESGWTSDDSGHWHASNCGHDVISGFATHNFGADDECDDCGYTRNHTHTYASDWSSDENTHWHASTCGHDVKADQTPHNYDGNYKCTDCGYQHTHTYATDWSNDATNHWKVSTCGHSVTTTPTAHNFGTDDICDDCGYTRDHTHTYSSNWSSDANNHWHASTCGHSVTTTPTAHNYDENYKCSDCGYQHEHTYSSDWATNETTHWHAGTCGHNVWTDWYAHNYDSNYKCTDCGYQHTHTYATDWATDATTHWHASTCGHSDTWTDWNEHTYDANYKCTTCTYQHEHTYQVNLSSDDWGHWNAASCGHNVWKDYVEHNFGTDDTCDDCGYVRAHVHRFATTWSNNENTHWHASTCGHDVKDGEAVHNFGNDNICDTCSYDKDAALQAWRTETLKNYNKFFTFSLDDGVTQDARFIELLDKYGLTATFNVNSGLLGTDSTANLGGLAKPDGSLVTHAMVTADQIRNGYYGNHEVASHTVNHKSLIGEATSKDAIATQVAGDASAIASLTGKAVSGMAYPGPGGNYDKTTRKFSGFNFADGLNISASSIQYIKQTSGIKYGRTIENSYKFELPRDFMIWNPTCTFTDPNLALYGADFGTQYTVPNGEYGLFYVWGHTYEFDQTKAGTSTDYWADIEAFLGMMGDINRNGQALCLTNEQVYLLFADKIPSGTNKYSTLAFDDGTTYDTGVIDILNANNIPATFYINSGIMGNNLEVPAGYGTLNASDGKYYVRRHTLQEIQSGIYNGHEISAHGSTHAPGGFGVPATGMGYNIDTNVLNPAWTTDAIIQEINLDIMYIADITGVSPIGIAYPGGDSFMCHDAVGQIYFYTAAEYGRMTTSTNSFAVPVNWPTWYPTCSIDSGTSVTKFNEFINSTSTDLQLFYAWDHPWAFMQGSNKAQFETLTANMKANSNKVCYMTNREIYRLFRFNV